MARQLSGVPNRPAGLEVALEGVIQISAHLLVAELVRDREPVVPDGWPSGLREAGLLPAHLLDEVRGACAGSR